MCLYPAYMVPSSDGWHFSYSKPCLDLLVIDPETGEAMQPFPVSCGRCIECLDNHRRQWVFRLRQEASLWKENSFLTLTYSDAPENGVEKSEVQAFIKKLRKRLSPLKIRYFACGEYGSKGRRPHYHIVIFNYGFPDKIPYRRDRSGNLMYRSNELESIWTKGFSSILPVCSETLNYVTKDMQKLLPLSDGRNPPFTLMSLKPGIGIGGWNRKCSDGKIWLSGESCHVPRYYVKVAQREGVDLSEYYRNQASLPVLDVDQTRVNKELMRYEFFSKFFTK